MTERHHTPPAAAHGHSRSEEDRIHTGAIVWVGVAALVVFFVASLGTATYFQVQVGSRPGPGTPAEVGSSKIGLVEQDLFDVAYRGQRDFRTRRERLGAYGWVDRDRGVAHLPIERAMELAAKGVRAPKGTPSAPAPGGAL